MLKKYLHFIIPVISVAICSLLLFTTMDKKVADWFQRPLRSTAEDKQVVMVNVDDDSVNAIGRWPFSREVYAKSLMVLKELGAESVVFDLSFVDKSESKVDERYVKEVLPEYVADGFETIDDKVMQYMGYFSGLKVSEDEAEQACYDILDTTATVKNTLETNLSYVIESQDLSLARAMKYFGNTYVTLTFDDSSEISDDFNDYLKDYIALDNIEVINDTKTPVASNVLPAIEEFMTQSKRAGFVNADPDKDNYMRRVNPVVIKDGKYYGQLVLVPLLNHFGNPKMIITSSTITLKECKFADGSVKDIKIPRGEDGRIILKYPKTLFVNYNDTSLYNIYRIALLDDDIKNQLQYLNDNGFFEVYGENDETPYEAYSNVAYIQDSLMEGSDDFSFDDYISYRNVFFELYDEFLYNGYDQILIDGWEADEELTEVIRDNFAICRNTYNKIINARESIQQIVQNSMCIIGTNATSTTDYGLNQYEEHYPNPGVHYTFANMILAQDFVDDAPAWVSILIAAILCLAYSYAANKIKSTGKQIILGITSLAVTILLMLLFFVITRRYLGLVVPFMALFVSFVANTIAGFITASHDKRFITNAFSQCLSKEVVADIVANPSSFKLGGQRLEMTAMFTDIQKFSSFSELLSAGQLVALLNYYLTKMSDIIMDERGTVDKYEGDAIIALVGAPVKMEDHAQRACAAAIKMKKAEVEMNKEIHEIAAGEKPEEMDEELYSAFKIMVENQKTIFTRIGLNSGEMIAGYMGSENKKNYTMMGNNVNLASRLEGVNKQYHTSGIMISEATRNLLGDRFLVRSLDRVRVVNVNTPIRLYELIDEKELCSEDKIAYFAKWEEALKLFENKEFDAAADIMNKLLNKNPKDAVARYYLSLINNFFLKGTYPTDKDDVGVDFNPEEFVFKLLQK